MTDLHADQENLSTCLAQATCDFRSSAVSAECSWLAICPQTSEKPSSGCLYPTTPPNPESPSPPTQPLSQLSSCTCKRSFSAFTLDCRIRPRSIQGFLLNHAMAWLKHLTVETFLSTAGYGSCPIIPISWGSPPGSPFHPGGVSSQ